jgi:glycosyltransferase involved in cell wall biosynthesis
LNRTLSNNNSNEKNEKYAVLIPAYNEADSIRKIVINVLQHVKTVLVINDGCTDQTAEKIKDLPITIVRNTINRGKDSSLLRGFSYALNFAATGIITIDADNQHDPNDIPRLIAAAEKYPNRIIMAARLINRRQAPKDRLLANKIADFFVSWAAGHKIIDSQSGFRLYPRKFIESYTNQATRNGRFLLESAILIDADRAGYQTAAVPIRSHYPTEARASYFRSYHDTFRIAGMLARKLTRRFFNLPGLIRAIFTRGLVIKT